MAGWYSPAVGAHNCDVLDQLSSAIRPLRGVVGGLLSSLATKVEGEQVSSRRPRHRNDEPRRPTASRPKHPEGFLESIDAMDARSRVASVKIERSETYKAAVRYIDELLAREAEEAAERIAWLEAQREHAAAERVEPGRAEPDTTEATEPEPVETEPEPVETEPVETEPERAVDRRPLRRLLRRTSPRWRARPPRLPRAWPRPDLVPHPCSTRFVLDAPRSASLARGPPT